MPRIENRKVYPGQTRHAVVEYRLDQVPGAYHRAEDLPREIAQHRYVKSVTFGEVRMDHDDGPWTVADLVVHLLTLPQDLPVYLVDPVNRAEALNHRSLEDLMQVDDEHVDFFTA